MGNPDRLVDGDALFALTEDLRAVRRRVEEASVSEQQRQRWQHTLGSIAEGAATDIERASAQLRRFAAQVERALG